MGGGGRDLGYVLKRRGKVIKRETKENKKLKRKTREALKDLENCKAKGGGTKPLGDRFFEKMTGRPAPKTGGRRPLQGGATGLKK